MCTDLCPRYLLGHHTQPHKMMSAVNYSTEATQEQKIAYLCCQCNLCELFSCPVGLYPKSANQMIKQRLIEKNIRFQADAKEFTARSGREFRLVPSKRLIHKLGLHQFDQPAPLTDITISPDIVYIAKSQHVGAPALPIINVGEHVEAGQLIGRIPENSLGAAIHASISGTVIEIGDVAITIRRD